MGDNYIISYSTFERGLSKKEKNIKKRCVGKMAIMATLKVKIKVKVIYFFFFFIIRKMI